MKCPHCDGTGEVSDSELLFGKNSDLPVWLPLETWEAYLEMRKKIKRPLTEYGKKLALRELDTLRHQNNPPITVLEQSIFNCHQGLFPIRHNGHTKNTPDLLETERQREENYRRRTGNDPRIQK